MTKPKLSKSQYIKGLFCPLRLWLYKYQKDLIPEIDEAQQAVFDTGHEVGLLAQKYFDGGIEITEDFTQISKAIISTQKAVTSGEAIIYEACACSNEGVYSRIDILKKVDDPNSNEAEWDLIEVKSSTKVHPYHIDDLALQYYAFTGAGYKIRKCFLMHINNQYVRNGEIDIRELFTQSDITSEVLSKQEEIKTKSDELLKLDKKNKPKAEIGPRCKKHFKCEYKDHCWPKVPKISVFNFFSEKKALKLIDKKIVEPKDLNKKDYPKGNKLIELEAYLNKTTHIEKDKIKGWLNSLTYPVYHFDFETINPAIPLFDGMTPYKMYPFQFSLHIQETKGGPCKHIEFLNEALKDFREDIIKSMLNNLGKKGSIIAYYSSFEMDRIKDLASDFPKYSGELLTLLERFVDIYEPFKNRWLYHPNQNGSASLKATYPSFIGNDYSKLEIQEGGNASRLYLDFLKSGLNEKEKNVLLNNLKKYCELDTLAMVKLLELLYNNS